MRGPQRSRGGSVGRRFSRVDCVGSVYMFVGAESAEASGSMKVDDAAAGMEVRSAASHWALAS